MEEIKSVKVDNWGVFFLQKLQNFFNKTDYCDLTLQFNDNSQLKVHRLVLSACTDYFNVLEQTCEMIEDVLIMPLELQADVVVPIVNFMYTGTLEFELKMYGKLLKTAKDMNMTVLLKLLEAHRRTMEGNHPKPNRSPQKPYRRLIPVSGTGPGPGRPRNSPSLVRTQNIGTSAQTVQRRIHGSNNSVQYKTLQIKPVNPSYFPGKNLPESAQILAKYPHSKTPVKGPSRFDCNEDNLPPETFEPSFDSISYESKPLICKEEPEAYDYDNLIRKHETYASPFEQLRRGYTNNNNKRPSSSVSSYESPPEKKPNIQDVKEYAEQQRMRKQIAQEFDDDNEFDEVLDDEFQNDDDDDDYVPPASVEKQIKKQKASSEKAVTYKKQPKQHAESSQRPTIVVKDTTSANVNHAKIISEVLRKYPHLVKNNKNIKLKIMPQTGGKQSSQQKIIVKTEAPDPVEKEVADIKIESSISTKPITTLAITKASPPPPPPSVGPAQPRRIDSKTMHSLIALGAENRTGPWLCLRCGVNGRPISIPSYRGFRRHLINTHKEKIDPRLCEHCGWRSSNNRELYHHMYADHTIKPPANYIFPKCSLCNQVLIDNGMLEKHMVELHDVKKENEECMYCNKTFARNIDLYSHMKTQHRDRAREDGVLDFSDDDTMESDAEAQSQMQNESSQQKIKILSDISLPKNVPIIESNTGVAETVELNSIGTGIAASLGLLDTNPIGEEATAASSQETEANAAEEEPRFVNVDGSEMELTPAQRREIMSQIGQQHDGLVMVLNEEELGHETAEPSARNVTGDNMLLVYSHEGVDMETIITTDKVAEDKIEENEAEIKKGLEEDLAEAASSPKSEKSEIEDVKKEKPNDDEKSPTKPNDSLDLKMKLLTDWADEEEEEEEEEDEEAPHEKEDEIEKSSEKSEKEADREDVKTPSNDTTDGEILFETIATVELPTEKKIAATEEPEEKDDTTEKQLEEMEKETKPQTPENSKEKSQPGSPMEVDNNEKTDPLKVDVKDDDPEETEEKYDAKPEETSSDVEEKEEDQNEEEKTKKKDETGSSKVDEEKPVSDKEPGKKNAEGDLILTKADIKNLIADWGDEDDENEI